MVSNGATSSHFSLISHTRQQLMRNGWWPASIKNPQTCATIACLRLFHKLNACSKISVHEFYRAIERLTDNTGTQHITVSVLPFVISATADILLGEASRLWRHGQPISTYNHAQAVRHRTYGCGCRRDPTWSARYALPRLPTAGTQSSA